MTNYSSGAAVERAVKKLLEKEDYSVVRSAGSHGPADLVAGYEGKVMVIQCKGGSGRMTKDDVKKLMKCAFNMGALPLLSVKKRREPVKFFTVSNDGSLQEGFVE